MVSPDPIRSSLSNITSNIFKPILAGATLKDRALACAGAVLGIGLTGLVCSLSLGQDPHLPAIVAPIGASAVLIFAVPSSPLAQPWSIIGGNTISALIGILVSRVIHDPMLAIGVAVGLAIAAMSLARCLHPPGGAAALTAVIGGPAVAAAGFSFALMPVALNSVLLVCLGWAFHRFSPHSYPHRAAPVMVASHKTDDLPPQIRTGFSVEDVDAALTALGEPFDIGRDDIEALLRLVERHYLSRSTSGLRCKDIMSRDVVTVGPDATFECARDLLIKHRIRSLPVVDPSGRLAGTVGLRELVGPAQSVGNVAVAAATSSPQQPALSLLQPLTDGRVHAVVIVNSQDCVVGLVSQTDLLMAMSKLCAVGPLNGFGSVGGPNL